MTREEAIKIVQSATVWTDEERDALAMLIPELAENEDERIRRKMLEHFRSKTKETWCNIPVKDIIAYLEKQKENPKSADSIPSDCTSDVKCEDRWHKVTDSLPDNGRLVLAKDYLGNVLLARYDGENWEVNVYDNEDHYCHNSISKWCEIPSEKQKEQKPAEWSEEDEEMLGKVLECIRFAEDHYQLEQEETNGVAVKWWLLDHIIPQPKVEWSEEDEKEIDCIINILDRLGFEEFCKSSRDQDVEEERFYYKEIQCLKRLKSLRQQKLDASKLENFDPVDILNRIKREWPMAWEKVVWKPSEDQMKALNEIVNILAASPFLHQNDYLFNILNGLREELKKLL